MKKYFVPRIPKGMVEVLRHKGGAQTSRKGKKGYNRREARYHLLTDTKYLNWTKYHTQQRSRLPLTYTCPRCGHNFTAAG